MKLRELQNGINAQTALGKVQCGNEQFSYRIEKYAELGHVCGLKLSYGISEFGCCANV